MVNSDKLTNTCWSNSEFVMHSPSHSPNIYLRVIWKTVKTLKLDSVQKEVCVPDYDFFRTLLVLNPLTDFNVWSMEPKLRYVTSHDVSSEHTPTSLLDGCIVSTPECTLVSQIGDSGVLLCKLNGRISSKIDIVSTN